MKIHDNFRSSVCFQIQKLLPLSAAGELPWNYISFSVLSYLKIVFYKPFSESQNIFKHELLRHLSTQYIFRKEWVSQSLFHVFFYAMPTLLVSMWNSLRSALVYYTCKRHGSEYSLLTICYISNF